MRPTNYPAVSAGDVGWLSEEQMIEVDRIMMDDLHIGLIQMMENAGRNLARLVLALTQPRSVLVLSGSGGNGGGGLVAARHLSNAGVNVTVWLSRQADEFSGVPLRQLDILQRMGVSIRADEEVNLSGGFDAIVDALIGYSLRGSPRGRIATMIEQIPQASGTIVSLDTPSGLDVTSGVTPGLAVQAEATMTLALPKVGLRTAQQVGELYIADISVPPQVWTALDVPAPDFALSSIVNVR